jgi:hypothetical protein
MASMARKPVSIAGSCTKKRGLWLGAASAVVNAGRVDAVEEEDARNRLLEIGEVLRRHHRVTIAHIGFAERA